MATPGGSVHLFLHSVLSMCHLQAEATASPHGAAPKVLKARLEFLLIPEYRQGPKSASGPQIQVQTQPPLIFIIVYVDKMQILPFLSRHRFELIQLSSDHIPEQEFQFQGCAGREGKGKGKGRCYSYHKLQCNSPNGIISTEMFSRKKLSGSEYSGGSLRKILVKKPCV